MHSGEKLGTPWTSWQLIAGLTYKTTGHLHSVHTLEVKLVEPIQISYKYMSLDFGRKVKYARRTHTDARKPWKLHTETDLNPVTQFMSTKAIKTDFKHTTTSAWMQMGAVQGRHPFRIINTESNLSFEIWEILLVLWATCSYLLGVTLIIHAWLPSSRWQTAYLHGFLHLCAHVTLMFPATSANIHKTVWNCFSLSLTHTPFNKYDKDTSSLGMVKGLCRLNAM